MYITFLRLTPSYFGHAHISPSASAHKVTASYCEGMDVAAGGSGVSTAASEDDVPPEDVVAAVEPPGVLAVVVLPLDAAGEPLISTASVS